MHASHYTVPGLDCITEIRYCPSQPLYRDNLAANVQLMHMDAISFGNVSFDTTLACVIDAFILKLTTLSP